VSYELFFDEKKFWKSRDFVELWEHNIRLESLSKRRRELKFWID
jgi:hypothetical protein